MIVVSCPLRVSLFGGSTDNPHFVEKYGYGSVISFTCDLKTYVTISQDKVGYNKNDHRYIIDYSSREEVSNIEDIKNEVVRIVLEHFQLPPVRISLTSDAYSQGSGLASSSSYLISLIKASSMFLNISMTDIEICRLAYELELKINPYCGYQDPYGCGIGGFKKIEFLKGGKIKYDFKSTELFEKYDAHLIFTGITRNSKNILKDVSDNLEKIQPLLETVELAECALINGNHQEFLNLLNLSWEQKKQTSSYITENSTIKSMDRYLQNNRSVIAHKLCGAGNGGFFLVFSKKNNLSCSHFSVRINVVPDGVVEKIV